MTPERAGARRRALGSPARPASTLATPWNTLIRGRRPSGRPPATPSGGARPAPPHPRADETPHEELADDPSQSPGEPTRGRHAALRRLDGGGPGTRRDGPGPGPR